MSSDNFLQIYLTKKVGQLNESISQTTAENKKSEEGFKSLKLQLREAVIEQQKLAQQYSQTSAHTKLMVLRQHLLNMLKIIHRNHKLN